MDKTGEKNRISMEDSASIDFFKDIGLFEERAGFDINTELEPVNITPVGRSTGYNVSDEILVLEPENSVQMVFDKTVSKWILFICYKSTRGI